MAQPVDQVVSGTPVADNTWAMIGAAALDTQIPIGGGGLSTITPVADNRLAVWGRAQTYFDSGTLRFRVGRRNTSDATSLHYGVHFQTDQGDGSSGDNTGFIVVVQSSDGTVRFGTVSGTSITYLFVSPLPTVAKDEYVEVVWGPRGITGESKYINVYKYDSNLQNRTLILSNTPATILNPAGGRVGVCAAASAVPADGGDLWITNFYFKDTLRKLSDYGDTTSGSGANTYRNTPGRLYEYPASTHSNDTPAPLRTMGVQKAELVEPLTVLTSGADASRFDPLHGQIGVVNIGISNSGDFFSGLLIRLQQVSRNAAVAYVNAAEMGRLANEIASRTNAGWTEVYKKLAVSGLTQGATASPSMGDGSVKRFPQVQVVITSTQRQWNAGTDALFLTNATDLAGNLDSILTNLLNIFPNLRLVLLHNCNHTWCVGNAGVPGSGMLAGQFAEPGLGEQWKWGIKTFISERLLTPPADTVFTDWLTELWGNTSGDEPTWPCFGSTDARILENDAHPNTAGEDYGGERLLDAVERHLATQAWFRPQVYDRLTVVPASASAWTDQANPTVNSLSSNSTKTRIDHLYRHFNMPSPDGHDEQHIVYLTGLLKNHVPGPVLAPKSTAEGGCATGFSERPLTFDLQRSPRTAKRALLQLWATNSHATQRCTVDVIADGWGESEITWNNQESKVIVLEPLTAEIPNGSRSHAITYEPSEKPYATRVIRLKYTAAGACAAGFSEAPYDLTATFNKYRGRTLSLRLTPKSTSDASSGQPKFMPAWYSRFDGEITSDTDRPSPSRGPLLLLTEKGIDEPFAYQERAIDSMLAERLR